MASLTEMIMQQSGEAVAKAPSVASSLNEGIRTGINLATMKEQIESQKLQVQMQQEAVASAKVNRVAGMIRTATAITTAPKAREAILTSIQKSGELTLDDAVKAQIAGDEETRSRLNTLFSDPEYIRNIGNSRGWAMLNQASNDLGEFNTAIGQATTAQKEMSDQIQMQQKMQAQAGRRLSDFIVDVNKRVGTDLKKLGEGKSSIKNAYQNLAQAIAAYDQGKPEEAKILFNNAGPLLLKGLVPGMGPISDKDADRIMNINGIQGKLGDVVNKWITGGFDPRVAKQLLAMSKTGADIIDERGRDIYTQISPMFSIPEYAEHEDMIRKSSGIDNLVQPTITPEMQSKYRMKPKMDNGTIISKAAAKGATREQIESKMNRKMTQSEVDLYNKNYVKK